MHFVTCPKQGFEMEAVVLHGVGFLEYFCPKQGQDIKPTAAPLYPNVGQVSSSPPPPLPDFFLGCLTCSLFSVVNIPRGSQAVPDEILENIKQLPPIVYSICNILDSSGMNMNFVGFCRKFSVKSYFLTYFSSSVGYP